MSKMSTRYYNVLILFNIKIMTFAYVVTTTKQLFSKSILILQAKNYTNVDFSNKRNDL